jgi:hypothetical protein
MKYTGKNSLLIGYPHHCSRATFKQDAAGNDLLTSAKKKIKFFAPASFFFSVVFLVMNP